MEKSERAGVMRGCREKQRQKGGGKSEGQEPQVDDEADGGSEPEKTGGKI